MKKRYKYFTVDFNDEVYVHRCLDVSEQQTMIKKFEPLASAIGSQSGIVRSAIRQVQAGASWPVVMAK
jgi:hypothetical protein